MDWTTVIGLLAGGLTTIAFLPQVIKTWQSKSTKDISLSMFLSFCVGLILWIVYGTLTHDIPVLVANVVTLLLAGTILAFKLRYNE